MRLARLCAALALAAPAGAGAQPFAYPAFPRSTDFSVVARWLEAQTDAPRGDLLDSRDGFAIVLLPGPADEAVRTVRLEALTDAAWRAAGGRSARVDLDFGCAPPKAAPGRVELYAGSNLRGDRLRTPARLPVTPASWGLIAGLLCRPDLRARALNTGAPLEAPAPLAAPRTAPVGFLDGPYAVQVGAFLTRAGAARALDRTRRAVPWALARRLVRIEPFAGGGRTFYRALVVGFADEATAEAFCANAGKGLGACLVRRLR